MSCSEQSHGSHGLTIRYTFWHCELGKCWEDEELKTPTRQSSCPPVWTDHTRRQSNAPSSCGSCATEADAFSVSSTDYALGSDTLSESDSFAHALSDLSPASERHSARETSSSALARGLEIVLAAGRKKMTKYQSTVEPTACACCKESVNILRITYSNQVRVTGLKRVPHHDPTTGECQSLLLKQHFEAGGCRVEKVTILEDGPTKTRGMGFVFFKDSISVTTAIHQESTLRIHQERTLRIHGDDGRTKPDWLAVLLLPPISSLLSRFLCARHSQ